MFKILTPYTHQTIHSLQYTHMTYETYRDGTKSIVMKIHKYKNILEVISLNFNAYNSCNHFSKSWRCKILCVYMQSLAPFIVNATHRFHVQNVKC
jgi:hypothetical protein